MDLALIAVIAVLATVARLPNLDVYTISFPEGIRVQQLFLMSAGYRPCVEIFCNQGPLLFYALYPAFWLFGETLAAARLGNLAFATLGLCGVYWVGRVVWGRPVALVAAVLVALSPTYVKFSRLALAEVPAVAPAILAVGTAELFRRSLRDRWLLASALLVALSLLLKPVTLAVCAPVGILVLLAPAPRLRNLVVLGSVTFLALVIPTWLIGFSEILEQIVGFRWRTRESEGRGIDWNALRIVEELANDRLGLVAIALAGVVAAVIRRNPPALAIGGWLFASLALLLVHTPLHGKHIVTLIPPLALLGAAAIVEAVRTVRALAEGRRGLVRLAAAGALLMACAGYAISLPSIVQRDWQLTFAPEPIERDPPDYWYGEVADLLATLLSEREMVVTDHPYLPFAARRMVPPMLVESSLTRILAQSLSASDAIGETQRHAAVGVLFWADKIVKLREYREWVEASFIPIRVWGADSEATPTLLVRPDRVGQAELTLQPLTPSPIGARYDGLQIPAAGWPATVGAGDRLAVTLQFLAEGKPAADYAVQIQLRSGEQVIARSEEIPLGGVTRGSSQWADGRRVWVSSLIVMPRTAPPGRVTVSARLLDSRARRVVEPRDVGQAPQGGDPRGITLGTLDVTAATAAR
ncbi:MAG: glycosyltransferase family 39 protein [Chloroflexota bacterium]